MQVFRSYRWALLCACFFVLVASALGATHVVRAADKKEVVTPEDIRRASHVNHLTASQIQKLVREHRLLKVIGKAPARTPSRPAPAANTTRSTPGDLSRQTTVPIVGTWILERPVGGRSTMIFDDDGTIASASFNSNGLGKWSVRSSDKYSTDYEIEVPGESRVVWALHKTGDPKIVKVDARDPFTARPRGSALLHRQ